MLMRICLIVAILAGLAVGGLNFAKVKVQVQNLTNDRNNERTLKEEKTTQLAGTNAVLKKTSAELAQTKTELASTKEERDQAVTRLASETKRATTFESERNSARKERDDAQAELQAYKGTDLKPEQILALNKLYKDLQKSFEGALDENRTLGRQLQITKNELAIFKTPEYVVPLPPGLHGKVLVTDPKWNFVIINVGQEQGVLEHGEMLVNRNGKLVAKVKVRSVQKDRSIANVLPGWQLGEVLEGDQVIPAHPASS
jgi:hypothetical protein